MDAAAFFALCSLALLLLSVGRAAVPALPSSLSGAGRSARLSGRQARTSVTPQALGVTAHPGRYTG